MQYFICARKSSDSEDRQMLSIEAQELRDFARQNKLSIVKIFTESMSAKQPGRPVFNQMLTELERGEADGIISWHPDRLARNMYDGGRLLHLIDQGLVQDLKFPNFYFDKTANSKFNLSIAFSQAQYFVDGLRENVNRGIRQKLRKGEFPGKAPYGYINHHMTRTIEPDPEHFSTMKKLLNKFADGEINYKEMRELMFVSGIKGARNNKAISFSTLHNLLSNPFYYGVFKLKT